MAKHLSITVLVAAFFCSISAAQNTTPPTTAPGAAQTQQAPATQGSSASPAAQNQNPSDQRIAPGIVVPVRLTKSIDAKKAKPGDEVLATVTQDLKTTGGVVIVAKDTKIVGHVTDARARNKEQKESEVGIAFDRAVSKTGDMNLPMSIQAIVAPPSNPSDNSDAGYGRSGPATGGATATSPMGSRNGPMEGSPPPPSPSAVPPGGSGSQAQNSSRPPITGNTHGVIGMPDLRLEETTQNATQGSVVTSEKSNVRLESGTLMLLRVN
jgi:hypothetical protein